jgi:alkylation response protein AidB-like acyl-CoA dehydrogenase
MTTLSTTTGYSRSLGDLIEEARRIARDVEAPRAEREDAEGLWPGEAMRALQTAGLMGLQVPVELGGHGLGMEALVAISQELARESPSLGLCFAMHCVGTACIAANATDDQKERYLVPIAEGRHITTLALSEPGTGANFYVPETRLVREDGGYRVTGTKSFVTNGGRADSYVMSTAALEEGGGAADPGAFTMVLLEEGSPGMVWGAEWHGFGMRSNSSRTVELEGVRVDRRQVLGDKGDELWYVFEVVAPYFLMAMAGTYLGVAVEAVELTQSHMGGRRHSHSGELLASNPALAAELGSMWTERERTRALVRSAARAGDRQEEGALPAILASKLAAAETAVDVCNRAMTLGGGRAYAQNSKLARLLRDARASHVMAPTTHMLKTWVGRAILGQPLL